MQGPRHFDLKKLPPKVKAKVRKLLRERWDREAAEQDARTTLQRLLEAVCQHDKATALGLLWAELRLLKGGCPAPADEYARKFIPELEAVIHRLEAADSIDAFLKGERR